ncbi:hypothetical protein ACHAXT_010588 [Thalassiosira profunda]
MPPSSTPAGVALVAAASLALLAGASLLKRRRREDTSTQHQSITDGGYESLIGHTPLLYLPHLSSLLPNGTKIYAKMESMNPGGTGKDRAARSMILDAESRGELPPPIRRGDGVNAQRNGVGTGRDNCNGGRRDDAAIRKTGRSNGEHKLSSSTPPSNIPPDVHDAIVTALQNTQTNGILVEGTSGSTGISLASISCSRGHGVIVVLPDDQSTQKADFLRRLGCGVVVVKNCSISNPGHYVNVARRVWEWLQVERRYDAYYWENVAKRKDGSACNGMERGQRPPPKLIKAAFMNQFENLANLQSHYTTTGPEIYTQLEGKVDAFVMSAGTGGTLVGVGGYLKERWWRNQRSKTKCSQSPPRIVLVDPPGSALYNKIKYGVAYARQQSEQKLRRHRYDTLAEGIGLDRITANFGLGCESLRWDEETSFGDQIRAHVRRGDAATNGNHSQPSKAASGQSQIIDDAIAVTDQQAVYMAHHLLRHEGLFVGSSTAMNLVGALKVAAQLPRGSNVVTVVCDGGQRHTTRFWNRAFIEEWGLVWPGDADEGADIIGLLGISPGGKSTK